MTLFLCLQAERAPQVLIQGDGLYTLVGLNLEPTLPMSTLF